MAQSQDLIELILQGDVKRIEEALENGVRVNAILDDEFDGPGSIIINGFPVHTYLVLNDQPRFTFRNVSGEFMLHKAIRFGELNVVIFLLNRGADINIQNDDGDTALHNALKYGKVDVFYELLKHNPDINKQNKHNNTPLHYAIAYIFPNFLFKWCNAESNFVKYGPANIVASFSKREINGNDRNKYDNSPFQLAFKYGQHISNIISELLKRGADVNLKNSKGELPLDLSVKCEPVFWILRYLKRIYLNKPSEKDRFKYIILVTKLALQNQTNVVFKLLRPKPNDLIIRDLNNSLRNISSWFTNIN